MLQLTPQMRLYVAIEPTDFRKGIDGLAQVVRERLGGDPFAGAVFVFKNRRATAVKLLVYDGQGFWLCQKRLSTGRFRYWPGTEAGPARLLEAHQLAVLLSGGDFEALRSQPLWREVRAGFQ